MEEELKKALTKIEERLEKLEKKVGISPRVEKDITPPPLKEIPKRDIEGEIGRKWFNKIGIISLVVGIALLVGYTFQYLEAVGKISLGFISSLILIGLGQYLQKKYATYGKVLIGGGWSLLYFTTYAMHHIKAARLIDSEIVSLFLLGIVAVLMILISLKYKSKAMTSLAFFLGYVTAAISGITPFTLSAILILAAALAFVVHRMEWGDIAVAGVIATYATHYLWVSRSGAFPLEKPTDFALNSLFLILYFSLFTFSNFFFKKFKKEQNIAVALINTLAFYSLFMWHLSDWKPDYNGLFTALVGVVSLGLGFLNRQIRCLFVVHSFLGLSFLTLAIPIQFTRHWITIAWLIEGLLLVGLGFYVKEERLRAFGTGVLGLAFLKLITVDFTSLKAATVLGQDIHIRLLVALLAVLIFYFLAWLAHRLKNILKKVRSEHQLSHLFLIIATFVLTFFLMLEVDKNWISVVLGCEGFLYLIFGFLVKHRVLRTLGLIVLGLTIFKVFLVDLSGLTSFYRLISFIVLGVILLLVSFGYHRYKSRIEKYL